MKTLVIDRATWGAGFSVEQVLRVLRNLGHDTECGACMAIAFTGFALPSEEHTCPDGPRGDDGGLL